MLLIRNERELWIFRWFFLRHTTTGMISRGHYAIQQQHLPIICHKVFMSYQNTDSNILCSLKLWDTEPRDNGIHDPMPVRLLGNTLAVTITEWADIILTSEHLLWNILLIFSLFKHSVTSEKLFLNTFFFLLEENWKIKKAFQ